MNISANSLFHFTPKADFLINILKNNFIPRYSLENTELDFKKNNVKGAFPMVCFCDISLGQIADHISTYGEYGIGMSKEWAIKKQLNPIIYLKQNSHLSIAYSSIMNKLINFPERKETDNNIKEIIGEYLKILQFLKPYEGTFVRNGKTIKSVRFYNEREWRYIPILPVNQNYYELLAVSQYNDAIFLAQENSKMQDFALSFEPKDIKYLFVKDESEVHSMIQALRQIKLKYSSIEIDILASKIITTKQLREDF